MESDVVKILEAYPAEVPGTAIPDDEFHEEPHLEEANVLEEMPNAVRLVVMRIHKNLGHHSKELLCRAFRVGGANKIVIRVATELKTFARSVNLRRATCLQSWQIRSPN